ncbi:MAG TPA: transcription antitermination factor NusB, partial [Silvibacterium sp.]|nr:transcription antitermination factor NusB [Silvibacterium sp.]
TEDIFRVATAREAEIDALIEEHSVNWKLSRMAAVDRNLLRAAVAELVGFPGTPPPIVINEALEIARRYSAPESINFLNGVLDAIARARLNS